MFRVVALSLLVACGDDGAGGVDAGSRDATVEAMDGALPDGSRPRDDGGPSVPTATVHFIGRFDVTAPDDARFAWPGSAIATRFMGSSLTVDLEDGGENTFEVIVDGAPTDVLRPSAGRGSYELAVGLADGMHDLVLVRRTESFFGDTRFHGFSGATLVESPGPTRFIEVIGDSITCGYGVLGEGPGCSFGADTEAETYAWGALAAAAVGAAHTAIAYSGKGVYRNYGGDMTDPMPALFPRTFADDPGSAWPFTAYVPDVVVVNLGTNDFSTGDPGDPYVDAYVEFVAQIRARYPDAPILLAASAMIGGEDHDRQLAHLDTVRERSADPDVSVLDLAVQSSIDGYGCDYHPSAATHERMADALAARLRELMGW